MPTEATLVDAGQSLGEGTGRFYFHPSFTRQHYDCHVSVNTFLIPKPNATAASEIFAGALARTLIATTAILGVVCVLVAFFSPSHLTATISVALASMSISAASLTPGMMFRVPATGVAPNSAGKVHSQSLLLGATIAMGVRFAGTVALFVACRYQFGLAEGAVAFHVCGWYAMLTALEIFFLAHGASAMDSVVQTSRSKSKAAGGLGPVAADSFRFSQPPLTDSTIG